MEKKQSDQWAAGIERVVGEDETLQLQLVTVTEPAPLGAEEVCLLFGVETEADRPHCRRRVDSESN
jgi:hypothetical protein